MTVLRFTAVGHPAPQGSKSAVVVAGRARILEGRTRNQRERHADWRAEVTRAAWAAMGDAHRITPFLGPVAVEVLFRLPRPKSARVGWRWQWRRPDADKLARSVLDSLTVAGVVADDAQVARLVVEKVLAGPGEVLGCDVTVTALEHHDAPGVADAA